MSEHAELVEAMARGLQRINALSAGRNIPWESVQDEERQLWRNLAEGALVEAQPVLNRLFGARAAARKKFGGGK